MAKQKFELLEGTYTERGAVGKTYHRNPKGPPVYVVSDEPLDTMFENKFRRVLMESRAAVPEEPITSEDRIETLGTTGTTTNPPGESTLSPQGADVTEKFATAGDNDLKVFLHEGQYTVYDGDKIVAVGLKTAIQVKAAVKKYTEDGDGSGHGD